MTDRGIGSALGESFITLRDYDRWATLAWIDTALRYRRTVLGPWWLTLSTGVMIASVGLVWGAIFNTDIPRYMPFFASGVILWSLISGALTEGCNVFTNAAGLIKALPTPLMIHVHRMLARQMIILAHNAVLLVVLWAIFQWPVDWSIFLIVPGLIVVMIALTGGVLALGILCTRFRDVPQIIAAILQLLFLLTPIMWMPNSVRGKAVSILLDFNPFYYLVEIVRGPLLGQAPGAYIWFMATILSLASLLLGHALYGRFHHRVAYWL